ncbi:ABC transporter permease subunit [Paenibacillus sp. 5J-6]|uniref:ABC transporter permease subunit n=1 Tax=Paenibacillus silvestris TaxID=2606219 RepID=A0A6L8USJ9_9BACL|nr:carbohydrate ABC transporter permease [Paenibacillus silvestris]MZQ80904.1 ABC transporter permease subunit [Paenibacillus silvestris]
MRYTKQTTAEKIGEFSLYLVMIVITLITLYPFWNQVVTSVSAENTLYTTGMLLLPSKLSFESYHVIFQYKAIWSGYGNTILRTVLAVSLSLTFTALFAYPLSKKDLPFNRGITSLVLFTMLFSGGLIPNYLLIKKLGIYNSIWALVLPSMISAFNALIMRNFFRSIPESLEESARVDGAGYFFIFRKIIVPLSKPVLATVALWIAVQHWNAWFDALIYITDPKKQVLQVVLRKIIVDNNMDQLNAMLYQFDQKDMFSTRQLQATVIMFSVIPMLVIYPFVQKYFVKGIMIGAVKG